MNILTFCELNSKAVLGGELELSFVELILFGIHSPDYVTAHGLFQPLWLLFTYNPLKNFSCTTYCVCSVPVYTSTFGIIGIHLDQCCNNNFSS